MLINYAVHVRAFDVGCQILPLQETPIYAKILPNKRLVRGANDPLTKEQKHAKIKRGSSVLPFFRSSVCSPELRLFPALIIIALAFSACDNGTTTPGHTHTSDGNWTVTSPASILADEIETSVCTSCGANMTRPVSGTRLQGLIETVAVQGGSFVFGRCAQNNPTGGTLVTVRNFHIGKYPVTQGQWFAVMGNWPSFFTGTNASSGGNSIPATPMFNPDNLPVERVSWYDVLVFANKLSERDGLQPVYRINGSTNPSAWGDVPPTNTAAWNDVETVEGANGWRLPTEHEREFAAKGGTQSSGYTGTNSDTYFIWSGSNTVAAVAWHSGNSGSRTHPVGSLQANELGLYDMSGNVWEWTWDWWTPTSAYRVFRGGSWNDSATNTRSALRSSGLPAAPLNIVGFRLVRP